LFEKSSVVLFCWHKESKYKIGKHWFIFTLLFSKEMFSILSIHIISIISSIYLIKRFIIFWLTFTFKTLNPFLDLFIFSRLLSSYFYLKYQYSSSEKSWLNSLICVTKPLALLLHTWQASAYMTSISIQE